MHQLHPGLPRFRNWETEIDSYMFGREREPDEMDGVSKDIFLARATDPEMHERGQDGGLVSAILLWCLDNDRIDAALVSMLEGDGSTWKAIPGLGPHPRGDPGRGRFPLHLFGQHASPTTTPCRRAPSAWPWSG